MKPRRSSLDLPPSCRLKRDNPFLAFTGGEARLSSLLAEQVAKQLVIELAAQRQSAYAWVRANLLLTSSTFSVMPFSLQILPKLAKSEMHFNAVLCIAQPKTTFA